MTVRLDGFLEHMDAATVLVRLEDEVLIELAVGDVIDARERDGWITGMSDGVPVTIELRADATINFVELVSAPAI